MYLKNLRNIISLLIVVLIPLLSISQNTEKIELKLNKTFQKGNYEKAEKQALKYKKKYPSLDVANYYLSRLEIIKFNTFTKLPNKKQWNNLRKASNYSKKLSDDYSFWQDSIKTYYLIYIDSWDDDNYQSGHLKKVVKTYSTHTKDTLQVYFSYYSKSIAKPNPIVHKLPITDSLRSALIKYASKLVGIPYVYGGETPEAGFDCSGYVKYVYSSINIELPHNAQMQSQLEGKIIPLKDAKPGDLIFFGSRTAKSWRTQHAGIVYEFNENEPKVIHCVSRGVCIDGNNSSWDYYWKERVLFVKRLPQLEKSNDNKN